MTLAETMNRTKFTPKSKNHEPVWKGPEDAGDNGGISQSMLESRYN